MMRGAVLVAWSRRTAMEWWDKRHDANRKKLEDVIASAYLQGGIDALRDEVQRLEDEGKVKL